MGFWSTLADLFRGESVKPLPDLESSAEGSAPHDLASVWIRQIVDRRVPLVRLTRGPVEGIGRAWFADGTVLLVRSVPTGRLIAAAVACRSARVLVTGPGPGSDACLRWRGGCTPIVVVGPDQAD